MITEKHKYYDKILVRVTMRRAKRYFDNAVNVYITSSNININHYGYFGGIACINKNHYEDVSFDKHINTYKYYCCNSITGNRIKFYINEEDKDKI